MINEILKNILKILFLAVPFLITLNAHSQKILKEFPHLFYQEDFSKDEGRWPVVADEEGKYKLQDNEYHVKRHSKESVEIIKPNLISTLSSFRLIASVSVEPINQSVAGIVFMLQNDLSGYILEINTKNEYRIRKMDGVKNHFITGNVNAEGWVKSSFINGPAKINQLEVRADEMIYDIYINDSFIHSFADVTWRAGDFGLVIGPETTARITDIKLFTIKNYPVNHEVITEPGRHIIDSLSKENQVLKETIIKITGKSSEDVLKIITEDLQRQKSINDSLNAENQLLKNNLEQLNLELERRKPVPEKSND